MSTHDYDIANAAGAVVRADINAALEAIVTKNAGSSAPATTFAHQWWFDEANNLLKQRNAANTLWVTVALKDSNGWTPYYRGQAWGTPFDVSSTDLDDLDATTFFSGNNLTNAPFGGGGTFNGLHVKFSATTAFQLAWAATTSTLRGRQKTGASTWGSWTLLGAVQVLAGEITAGTESSVRMFSPAQVKTMIETHGGKLLQSVYAEYAGTTAITAAIAEDDTVPLVSEGTQILSKAITPASATNRLQAAISVKGAVNSAGQRVYVLVFAGSTFVGVVYGTSPSTNGGMTISGEVEWVAGGTSEITVSVRLAVTGGTFTPNGTSALGRLFGGGSKATLSVRELGVAA